MHVLCSMKRLAIVACIAMYATALGAQENRRLAQPDSIPFELASALMSAGSVGMDPQILVGAIPEWATSRIVLPPGARILGSAFVGTGVVAIVAVPRTTADSLIPRIRRDLLAHGWHVPPPFPSFGGGFRPAQMANPMSDMSHVVVCGKNDQTLSASAVPHRGGEVLITYRLATPVGYVTCKPPQQPAVAFSRPMYPTLYNPTGAVDAPMGSCSQSNGGWSGTSTAFRAPLSPDEILDRYGRQLADSGWTIEGSKPSIVGRTWTKPDSTGVPVQVSLYVTTTARDSACHEINMQVRSLKKP